MQLPYGYLEGEMLAVTKNRPHVPHVHLWRFRMTDRMRKKWRVQMALNSDGISASFVSPSTGTSV